MATAKAAAVNALFVDDGWEIEGLDVIDKATLVGIPFRITALSFRRGSRNIEYVYCDVVTADGTTATFNDSSSTGIKAQLANLWLERTGEEVSYPADGDWHDVRINVRHGLRVSEYVPDGRKEKARTYYLAANGERKTA